MTKRNRAFIVRASVRANALTLSAEHRAKSSKNAVFLHSLRTLYKVSRKT